MTFRQDSQASTKNRLSCKKFYEITDLL